jgi:hypothetical protein
MAHTHRMLHKQGYRHKHEPAHAHGYSHARMRAHAHTQICNTYCFSTATMIRERASMLRYTYIVRLVRHTLGIPHSGMVPETGYSHPACCNFSSFSKILRHCFKVGHSSFSVHCWQFIVYNRFATTHRPNCLGIHGMAVTEDESLSLPRHYNVYRWNWFYCLSVSLLV